MKHLPSELDVCFVSDQDFGGAAVACRRIRKAMAMAGLSRSQWIAGRGGHDAGAWDASAWPRYGALLRYEFLRRLMRSDRHLRKEKWRFSAANLEHWVNGWAPHVVAMFNLHEEVGFDFLHRVAPDVPLVVSLQDMWYLTGYCYYSMECGKYETGCKGPCPQMGRCGATVRSPAREWARRQQWYIANKHRIHLVAPSRWMGECAERRFGGMVPVSVIPNCVDTGVFRPIGSKAMARELLGLPPNGPIVLTGAVSVSDERKGGRLLLAAMQCLRERFGMLPHLAVFGADPELGEQSSEAIRLGTVQDEALLNLYYNAADVFVLPSRAESFGLVFVEAMAAGTPCVSFDSTGCRDTVLDGVTGFRAMPDNVEHLADCIRRTLTMPAAERLAVSSACRSCAEREFAMPVVGKAYAALCERAVASPALNA